MPQCTLGNVASARWACCCSVRNPCCCLSSHTVAFELSRVVLWLWLFSLSRFIFWLLIDLPDDCWCLLLFLCWTLLPPTNHNSYTHSHWMPHSPTPQFCSSTMEASTEQTLLLCCSVNTCLCHIAELFGGLRFTWLLCLLCFIMPSFKLSENLRNLRGLMKNKKLHWQIIWMFFVVRNLRNVCCFEQGRRIWLTQIFSPSMKTQTETWLRNKCNISFIRTNICPAALEDKSKFLHLRLFLCLALTAMWPHPDRHFEVFGWCTESPH